MQTGKTKKDGQVGQAGQDGAPAQTGTRRTKLYDVSQVGDRFDKLRASNMRPLDATVHAMRDRIVDCFADGYSITDVIELLQQAGIDGTDRQLRYALDRAGIHRRQTKRVRTAAVRRQAIQADTDSGTAESDAEATEGGQANASENMNAVQSDNDSDPAKTQTSSISDEDGGQDGDEHDADDSHVSSSFDSGNVQNGAASGAVGPQDAPGSDGDAAQANAMEQQARRPAWTPRPGALHAFGNADMSKLDMYKELSERRGRK